MDCSETLNLLTSYLDDELPLDIFCQVKSHVGYCPNCRCQLELETKTKQLVARMQPNYHVSTDFRLRLQQRLHQSKRGGRR